MNAHTGRGRARVTEAAILDALPDAVAVLVARRDPAGRVADVLVELANPAAARVTSQSPAQVVGRPVSDLVPAAVSEGLRGRVEQVLEGGAPADRLLPTTLPVGGAIGRVRERIVPLDGERVLLALTRAHPDIEHLALGAAWLKPLVEGAPDPILRVDADLAVEYANEAAARADPGRLLGLVAAGAARALRDGVAVSVEVALPVPGGAERRLLCRIAPEADGLRPARHAVIVARDVTDLYAVAAEHESCRRVAASVARGAPAESVAATVAEEAARLLGADAAGIVRLLPGGRGRVVGAWGRDGVPMLPVGFVTPIDDRAAGGEVLREGRTHRVADYSAPSDVTDETGPLPYRSLLSAPVHVAGRPWGFMTLADCRPGYFTARDELRLESFAGLVAVAVTAEPPVRSSTGDHLALLGHLARDARLTDHEADLLALRFGLDGSAPLGVEEVARELELTPQAAERVLARALRRLVVAMLEAVDEPPPGPGATP